MAHKSPQTNSNHARPNQPAEQTIETCYILTLHGPIQVATLDVAVVILADKRYNVPTEQKIEAYLKSGGN